MRRFLFGLMLLTAASAAASGAAADAPALRLGTTLWPGYEPLYLAAERNQWRQSHNVRLVEYPSASEVLRAFRNRHLEAAALTLDEVLTLLESQLPLRVVAVLDVSNGGDALVARPEIADMAALRGRRLGVETGALGAYMASRALERHGLTVEDVEIVPVDVSAHEEAYHHQTVDALVTFEPVRTRLLNEGAREIFSSRELPCEIVDVLVVREEVLAKQPGALRQIISDWFSTLSHMEQQPESTARFMARRLNMTPEELAAAHQGLRFPGLEENRAALSGELQPLVDRLHSFLQRMRLLGGTPPLDDLLDPAWLPR